MRCSVERQAQADEGIQPPSILTPQSLDNRRDEDWMDFSAVIPSLAVLPSVSDA
jgi:hypothetical protein